MRTKFTKAIVMLLYLTWVIFSGCISIKPLSIDVLVPPDTLVYPGLQSATLVCRNAVIGTTDSLFTWKPDSLINDSSFRAAVLNECLWGLADLLESSPGVDSVVLDTVASESIMHASNYPDDSLLQAKIPEICLNSESDIVILLEGVYAMDTLWYSVFYQPTLDGGEFEIYEYSNLALVLAARWSIYETDGCERLEQYLYLDTVVWSIETQLVEYEDQSLPVPEDAYLEAFYWAGNGYGRRMVSVWEKTERFYYCTNHKLMKQACLYASDNRWREAAIIWKELSDHKKSSLAAKACFNMALVCELEDKLDLAQSWIIKSYLLNRNWAVQNYLDIINNRIFVKKRYDF